MIDIKYNIDRFELTMDGHAGSAEQGKDLVCCAASVLANTLLAAVQNNEIGFDYEKQDDGFLRLELRPTRDEEYETHIIFMTVLSGLHELALQYPEYVSFKEVE